MKRQDTPKRTSRYLSYVVRCWQEHSVHAGRETRVWRFSLQNPRTNQRCGFATLEALLVSLQAGLDDDNETGQGLEYSLYAKRENDATPKN